MIYKTYECDNFNFHTVKTNKFKNCQLEIVFRKKFDKKTAGYDSLLCDLIADSSKEYNSPGKLIRKLEELYNAVFFGMFGRVGHVANSNFVMSFISPKYIKEEDYLENIIKFVFEVIQNPLVENGEFDYKMFNRIKKSTLLGIEEIKENPIRDSFRKALKELDTNSDTSDFITDAYLDIKKSTPSDLYKTYKRLFKDYTCEIYAIGDLDMDKVLSYIKKYYKNKIINNDKYDLYVENKTRSRVHKVVEKRDSFQTNLVILYNLLDLTKREKDVVFYVYNYLLGNGGLNSKLYQAIRLENSFCYTLSSMYLKYDNLLGVQVPLESNNVDNVIKLTNKCIKEMAKGNFTEEELNDAKRNIIEAIKMGEDNMNVIINNFVYHIIDDFPLIEDRIDLINGVTYNEILQVAKKIKINTIFVLDGGK